ncbi:hypothetical protein BKA81DRAFT_350396 [Phyllosticta paracitricarpa]
MYLTYSTTISRRLLSRLLFLCGIVSAPPRGVLLHHSHVGSQTCTHLRFTHSRLSPPTTQHCYLSPSTPVLAASLGTSSQTLSIA